MAKTVKMNTKDGKVNSILVGEFKKGEDVKKIYVSAYAKETPAKEVCYLTNFGIGVGASYTRTYNDGAELKARKKSENLPKIFVNGTSENKEDINITLWVNNRFGNGFTTTSKLNDKKEVGTLPVRFIGVEEPKNLNQNGGAYITIKDYYFGATMITVKDEENSEKEGKLVEKNQLLPILYVTAYEAASTNESPAATEEKVAEETVAETVAEEDECPFDMD